MPRRVASTNYVDILYEALLAPRGIIVYTTGQVDSLRARFSQARQAACDPSLDVLTFTPSPTAPQSELWIMRKDAPDASQEGV